MKIEINLNLENSAQMAAFAKFIDTLSKAEAQAESRREKLRDSRHKAEEQAEVKPRKPYTTAKTEPEAQPAEQPETPTTESKITLDDIRRVVAEKKEKHFQVMKFKLKEDFGVSKTPDLKPEQYEAFFNYVNGL